jgi:hypothetical protein
MATTGTKDLSYLQLPPIEVIERAAVGLPGLATSLKSQSYLYGVRILWFFCLFCLSFFCPGIPHADLSSFKHGHPVFIVVLANFLILLLSSAVLPELLYLQLSVTAMHPGN